LILVDAPPGDGPKLHTHPYEEVFVVNDGRARFTVGDTEVEVSTGDVVIAPPNAPHKFVNVGEDRLRLTNIHVNERFRTAWLEE
jgi:quercetin dioxygenase-like cupin family protein